MLIIEYRLPVGRDSMQPAADDHSQLQGAYQNRQFLKSVS